MKTMCPPGYHHNGFVATHPLGQMMYDIYIYIYYILVLLCNNKQPIFHHIY